MTPHSSIASIAPIPPPLHGGPEPDTHCRLWPALLDPAVIHRIEQMVAYQAFASADLLVFSQPEDPIEVPSRPTAADLGAIRGPKVETPIIPVDTEVPYANPEVPYGGHGAAIEPPLFAPSPPQVPTPEEQRRIAAQEAAREAEDEQRTWDRYLAEKAGKFDSLYWTLLSTNEKLDELVREQDERKAARVRLDRQETIREQNRNRVAACRARQTDPDYQPRIAMTPQERTIRRQQQNIINLRNSRRRKKERLLAAQIAEREAEVAEREAMKAEIARLNGEIRRLKN